MPKIVNKFPKLRAGDKVFVWGTGLFGRAIRIVSAGLPDKWGGVDDDPPPSHVALVYDALVLIEAVGKIRMAPLAEYEGVRVEVYRPNAFSEEMGCAYTDALVSAWNQAYGWTKIALFLLDSIFRTYWFTQKFGVTSFKVCSEFDAWAWEGAFGRKLIPGTPWQEVSPMVDRDYCAANHGEWTRIYKTTMQNG